MLLPHLNERQQRLALAAEARLLGHGGVRVIARIAGVSETTVRKGVFELERARIRFRSVESATGAVGVNRRPSGTRCCSRPCWRW